MRGLFSVGMLCALCTISACDREIAAGQAAAGDESAVRADGPAAPVAAPVPAAEGGAEETGDGDRGRAFVRGMWASLTELQSGEVEITETTDRAGRHETSTVFYSFDLPRKRHRFERRVGRRMAVSARNEDYTLLYSTPDVDSPLPRTVQKNLPDKMISLPTACPFDVQLIGIEHWHAFDQFWSMEEFRNVYEKKLYSRPATRVEREGDRLKLFWAGPDDRPTSDVTVVLDASAGYRPVRTEAYTKWPGRKDLEPEGWSETEWTKVNDVFVPRKWHSEALHKGLVYKCATEMEFKWAKVNTPMPDRLFTLDGLGLPNGTTIMNLKTGQPVREGKIGDTLSAVGPPPAGPEPARRLRWVLAANGAALLIAVGAVVGRRYRRS